MAIQYGVTSPNHQAALVMRPSAQQQNPWQTFAGPFVPRFPLPAAVILQRDANEVIDPCSIGGNSRLAAPAHAPQSISAHARTLEDLPTLPKAPRPQTLLRDLNARSNSVALHGPDNSTTTSAANAAGSAESSLSLPARTTRAAARQQQQGMVALIFRCLCNKGLIRLLQVHL